MKRDFLKGLELSDDIIDKIIGEAGKDIEKFKNKTDRLSEIETELKETKSQLEAKNEEISGLTEIKGKYDETISKYNKQTIDRQLTETLKKNGFNEDVLELLKNDRLLSDLKLTESGEIEALATTVEKVVEKYPQFIKQTKVEGLKATTPPTGTAKQPDNDTELRKSFGLPPKR